MSEKQPRRLNEELGVSALAMYRARLLNPSVEKDERRFIDPQLLFTSNIPEFVDARGKIEQHFAHVLNLLKKSKKEGDQFWQAATKRLTFREVKGVGIGFSQTDSDGAGVGLVLAEHLVECGADLLKSGMDDPIVFEVVGLFQRGFGSDRLSDIALRLLLQEFFSFTSRVAKGIGVTNLVRISFRGGEMPQLPVLKSGKPVILLPLSLLRKIPLGNDPSEIYEAADLNEDLRKDWNSVVWSAQKAKRNPSKDEIRSLFFSNPKYLAALFTAYKNSSKPSAEKAHTAVDDPSVSAEIAAEIRTAFPIASKVDNEEELVSTVRQMLDAFRKYVEDNGANHLLFAGGEPRDEKSSQALFYVVADLYAKGTSVEVSRESNAGRGPVDFKVSSSGYRCLVEFKLSNHAKLAQGYDVQLKIYQRSEDSRRAFYCVVLVNDADVSNVEELQSHVAELRSSEEHAPELVVIDARRKPSASKAKGI